METSQMPMLPTKTSGLAIASLVTGLIGVAPFPIVAPLAIIFGHMAMSRIKKSSGQVSGFGMALAGTILGYVGLVWCITAMIIISGATASTEESDRHGCFMNTRNVQLAVRGHQNMTSLNVGDPIEWNVIIGPDGYLPQPSCPAGGIYTFANTIPTIGTVICQCSHADHVPPSHADW